ncbi:hypothetical protein Cni_G06435 [Canna indica]|uniref:Uncharacterized protein n=1 Tax=Canna indica TaxID=4628 RepID=A0AAQ3JZC7_9LILI|nr:hypothetical protein Cni_G06435 [Canna indica]
MEVGLESSAWAGVSPRISFSHDLCQVDVSEPTVDGADRRLDLSLPLDVVAASSDFDFSLGADVFSQDPSLADDLFSDGKLLPLPIKNAPLSSSSSCPPSAIATGPPATPNACLRRRGSLREIMASAESDDACAIGRPCPQKPFWRFRRSSSLNCSSGSGGGSLCSFPLLRSKSSGSSSPMQVRPTAKQCKSLNAINATNATELFKKGSSSEPKTTRVYYYSAAASSRQRRLHGNAVRISPILNVPTPTGGGMGILSFLLCKRGDKSVASKSSVVTCSP